MAYYLSHLKGPSDTVAYVYIPPGSGLNRVADILKQNGLIHASWHFKAVTSLHNQNGKLRAGEYKIPPHANLSDILTQITTGKLHKRMLTIPEGMSNAQIKEILAAAPGLSVDFTMPQEGYLLPDTYFYHYGSSGKVLINKMEQKMSDVLDSLWDKRPADFPLKTKHELLTLASIVEKETGLPEERGKVAGVFLNRLQRHMRLQSDPSVIYGISQGLPLNRRLTSADLKLETAYNTYRIDGLPPGPIANPGLESIQATLFAEPVKYLYFVADGSGGHTFSSTLEQHNKNVRKWRKIRDNK